MKKSRCGFKRIALLLLTTTLLGGAANHMSLVVQAKTTYDIDRSNGGNQMGGSTYGMVGEERLTGDEKRIYDTLKSAARQIASGQRSTTQIAVTGFNSYWGSERALGESINRVISYLLMDCPYDFYWYDKDSGCVYSWATENAGQILPLTFSFTVAQEYQGSGIYVADSIKTAKAWEATEAAQTIVNRHRNESDYNKLRSYMSEICDLVSYDWDTYEDATVLYGNPWQPVWVFDGDESTNVVCEGYAKAFQYLCDLSTFRDAKCYTVEGAMSGGTGSGDYMWNIVTLEGSNYLVDVANCDNDSIGAPDQLFLAGTEGSIGNGYTFFVNEGNNSITYNYGDNQYGLLGDVLELASYSYVEPNKRKLKIKAPAAEEVTFGDFVDDQVLIGGSAVDGRGQAVSGVFRWADDVAFYGNAGTNTLNVIFTPDNPQYEPVKNIRVTVRINPRPVTASAEEKSKVYGQPDPELTYTYANVIEGYPLWGQLTRESGENAGTYSILQGSLTDANNPNYVITFTENNLKITPAANVPLEFVVGNAKATADNAVTLKSDASYGDLWSEIVKIGTITAKTGAGNDSDPGHFTLQESGTPGVGGGQHFHVLYNGTIGGQTYRNEVVCEGVVDVGKRVIQVSAGSYKVSKAYDKTRSGGTATGELALNNLLSVDANRVSVTAEPTGYADSNVSRQNRMMVNLTLGGVAANNYELSSNTLEVPCEITPKAITPTVKVSGSYSYTGRAITPTLTVSDGTDVLAASDYDMVLSNNRNTGTAQVLVRPKNGGNYTWSPAVETSFTIDKADYKGKKSASVSMEYGSIAVFSLYSMVSEGYKLGDIRVEDKDQIFAETPAISGTVLSCKLTDDRSKEGKTATITLPVTESTNYQPYDLTFTVTLAPERSGVNNQTTTASEGEDRTGQASVTSPQPITDVSDARPQVTEDGEDMESYPSANVTAVDRENSKSGRTGSINLAPIIGGALGIALAAGVVGGIYFVRRKRKIE